MRSALARRGEIAAAGVERVLELDQRWREIRTAQFNNGPNFDVRCERPVARVLYAIQNGGFSGVVMPQNIVVGQQARDVAQFVATYSGRKAPRVPGVTPCEQVPIGSIDAALAPASK